MDHIEPDALYDERGEVSRSRPLLQGDVFDDIVVPGLSENPLTVQVINHPCAMRRGPDLLPRITVAPVRPHQRVRGESEWQRYMKVMPLAALRDDEHFATSFADVTSVSTDMLTLDKRIASLTNKGIYVLQQRLVNHYTRLDVPLGLLHKESAPVLEEAHQQWDWVDTVLSDEQQDDLQAVRDEGNQYQAWLDQGDPCRRPLLKSEVNYTDLRKSAHSAAIQRQAGQH